MLHIQKTVKAYGVANHSLIGLALHLFNILLKSRKMNHWEVFTTTDQPNGRRTSFLQSESQSSTALDPFRIKVGIKHNYRYDKKGTQIWYIHFVLWVSSLRKSALQYISIVISVAVILSISYREQLSSLPIPLQFAFQSWNPGHSLLTVQLLYCIHCSAVYCIHCSQIHQKM